MWSIRGALGTTNRLVESRSKLLSTCHDKEGLSKNEVLLDLAQRLFDANDADETISVLLDGVRLLGFPRVRMYLCRQAECGQEMELVGESHRGPQDESDQMRRLFEEHELLFTPATPCYSTSFRCLDTGKVTVFRLGTAFALHSDDERTENITDTEDPFSHALLKNDLVDTWVDVPIVVAGVPRAKLSIDKKGLFPLTFQRSEIEALHRLRHFTEVAIEQHEARKTDQVVAITEKSLNEAMAGGEDVLYAVSHTLLHHVLDISQADGGHIRFFSPVRGSLVKMFAVNDGGDLWAEEKQPGVPLAGLVYNRLQSIIIENVDTSELAGQFRRTLAFGRRGEHDAFFAREKSLACFPLAFGRSCEGTVSLTSSRTNVFARSRRLLERVFAAVAPRIVVWRAIHEKNAYEERAQIVRHVLNLLDEREDDAGDRVRIMLVALTSGHGFAYNTSLGFVRDLSNDTVTCIGAIGFQNDEEAHETWHGLSPPEFGGNLQQDVRSYLSQTASIEAKAFPKKYIGCQFHLSQAAGPLVDAFLADGEQRNALREIGGATPLVTGTNTPLDQLRERDYCVLPVAFSGKTIGAIYLDNVCTRREPWRDREHVSLLSTFAEEVIGPTLLFDKWLPDLLARHSALIPPLTSCGAFLLDQAGVIRQSNRQFRQVMGGDSRGWRILELDSIKNTTVDKDVRDALSGEEIVRQDVPFRSVFGRRVDLDYIYTPRYVGEDKRLIGSFAIVLDAGCVRTAAKEVTAMAIIGHAHSMARLCAFVTGGFQALRVAIASGEYAAISQSFDSVSKCYGLVDSQWQRFRRLSRAAFAARFADMPLLPVLQEVVDQFKVIGSIHIETDYQLPHCHVHCDMELLRLAFESIMLNAVLATRETNNPTVVITVAGVRRDVSGPAVGIRFCDNGPGFSGRVLELTRSEMTDHELAGQVGLGLPLTRDIIGCFGGKLRVLSEQGSVGASVVVELPVQEADRRTK